MHGARPVLLILFLLAGSLSPPAVQAQETRSRSPGSASQHCFSLEDVRTVNPDTWIPFQLEECLFESSDSAVVSLRIFNILAQVVAIPTVQTEEGTGRQPIINLNLRGAGRRVAFWDGRDATGRRVPTGIYYAELLVNGRTRTKKLLVENPTRRRSLLPRL